MHKSVYDNAYNGGLQVFLRPKMYVYYTLQKNSKSLKQINPIVYCNVFVSAITE